MMNNIFEIIKAALAPFVALAHIPHDGWLPLVIVVAAVIVSFRIARKV